MLLVETKIETLIVIISPLQVTVIIRLTPTDKRYKFFSVPPETAKSCCVESSIAEQHILPVGIHEHEIHYI